MSGGRDLDLHPAVVFLATYPGGALLVQARDAPEARRAVRTELRLRAECPVHLYRPTVDEQYEFEQQGIQLVDGTKLTRS